MSRPDLVSMLLDVSIDPCDGSVHQSLQYVLIRGFSAMGWEQPKAASEDMAMEILKMIRPSSSNLASGGKVASREYPALGDRVATLLEDARCPKVTPAMEEAGRECARSNDPSTFADIFEAMWKARPTARPDTAEARLREALEECVEVLELVERPAFVDPDHGDEVAALGDRIGYGALMSSASASWRERLEEQDCPTGGEYVAGPCYKTILLTLEKARAALSPPSGGDEAKESEGAKLLPCPVCGGEAIHAIETLKRTIIKPDPSEPDRREIVAQKCADEFVRIVEAAERVAQRTGNTFVLDRAKVATMIRGHLAALAQSEEKKL